MDKKMWYMYTMEHYIAIKMKEFFICNNVNETGWHYSKWNVHRYMQILHGVTYMWNLKKKKKIKSREPQNRIVVTSSWGWKKWGMLAKVHEISLKRWINFGSLMYSMVTIFNNADYILEIRLREQILCVVTKNKNGNYVRSWMC